MHDIRLIRDDRERFEKGLRSRGVEVDVNEILDADAMRRSAITREQTARAEIKKQEQGLYLTIKNQLKDQPFSSEEERKSAISMQVSSMIGSVYRYDTAGLRRMAADREMAERRLKVLDTLPNLPAGDVPEGADENDNRLVREHGALPAFAFTPREHDAIGPALGMDFDTGVTLAGARFTLLRGQVARLSRALGQFMLSRLVDEHGYEEVAPPLLVRDEVAFGTGQLPKFAEDLFRTTDGRWLISTAEMSLTNIVRERILAEEELPLRVAALTPCFRSEAGAAGRDTRGLIRQHQFDKVEMVSITSPDASDAEHERMTACAEGVLEALDLPYRRMLLCTGDMGFSAARTYDLEVWLPGQARYREISSCSTCTDFQARRMNARYRPAGEKAARFVHTLNGSGLAVGRTLVAVIENYQQEDGSVAVPAVLRPYLGGVERLSPR